MAISENLAVWLAPYLKKSAPVWPHGHDYFYESQRAVALNAGASGVDGLLVLQNSVKVKYVIVKNHP